MLTDHLPEARKLAAQCWNDKATAHIPLDPPMVEAVAQRLAAWMDGAAMAKADATYYRKLLEKCGTFFGEECCVYDLNGSIAAVMVAKVPELVERLVAERDKQTPAAEPPGQRLRDLTAALVAVTAAQGGSINQNLSSIRTQGKLIEAESSPVQMAKVAMDIVDRLQRKLAPLEPINVQLHAQDNRITAHPMFCVQVKRRDVGYDSLWVDNHCWRDSANDETIFDDAPDFKEPEGDEWEKFGYVDRWETVMVAFTQAGCEEYLRLNGHNLNGETRIYAESFYRCPEMIAIREFLLKLSFNE